LLLNVIETWKIYGFALAEELTKIENINVILGKDFSFYKVSNKYILEKKSNFKNKKNIFVLIGLILGILKKFDKTEYSFKIKENKIIVFEKVIKNECITLFSTTF